MRFPCRVIQHVLDFEKRQKSKKKVGQLYHLIGVFGVQWYQIGSWPRSTRLRMLYFGWLDLVSTWRVQGRMRCKTCWCSSHKLLKLTWKQVSRLLAFFSMSFRWLLCLFLCFCPQHHIYNIPRELTITYYKPRIRVAFELRKENYYQEGR